MTTKFDKILYIFLISLTILIVGIQIGIKQGRALQQLDDCGGVCGYTVSD